MLNWFSQASGFELFALVTGLAAVVLLIRQNIWTWPIGVLYATVSVWVFYHDRLYGQLVLHLFYVAMNLYGWWYWVRGGVTETSQTVPVIRMPPIMIAGVGVLGVAGAVALAFGLKALGDAEFAWPDAWITSFSFVAMYLQARKYLECWVLWFVIDIGSVGLYSAAGLNFYALLYLVYLGLAIAGYIEWRRSLNNS